jgi:hypothetical protein
MSIGTIPPVTPVAQGEPEHKQAEGGKHETLTGQPTRRAIVRPRRPHLPDSETEDAAAGEGVDKVV